MVQGGDRMNMRCKYREGKVGGIIKLNTSESYFTSDLKGPFPIISPADRQTQTSPPSYPLAPYKPILFVSKILKKYIIKSMFLIHFDLLFLFFQILIQTYANSFQL